MAIKKADAKGRSPGTNIISELRFLDESRNDLYSMMSIAGISNDGKFLFEEGGSFNNAFTSLVHDVYSKLGFEAADRFQLDVANKFKSLVKTETKTTTIKELSKSQNIRLLDVFFIGPFMMYVGYKAKGITDLERYMLYGLGIATI